MCLQRVSAGLSATALVGLIVFNGAFRPLHAADRAARPNIILCMADDQGWGDTGYGGHPVLETPYLDDMAASGLVFRRFYAASPQCSPTRGSVLTGRHPYRYGIPLANQGCLPAEEWTLSELLQEQGYTTGHFGKWHLGTLSETDPSRGVTGTFTLVPEQQSGRLRKPPPQSNPQTRSNIAAHVAQGGVVMELEAGCRRGMTISAQASAS